MQKPDPENYLQVMSVFLERMKVKKLIIGDYKTAKEEVYLDMVSYVPKDQQEVFRKALDDFEAITDLVGWYNED